MLATSVRTAAGGGSTGGPRSLWARVAGVVALLAVSGLLGLGLVELGLRVTGMFASYVVDPIFQQSAFPGVSYEFRPGARGRVFGNTWTEVNAEGLRGPELAREKPLRTYRIGVFGDSVTFGQGVQDEETYARVLERRLRTVAHPRGARVEVLNFGVPAYNVTNIVSSFTEKGARLGLDVAVLAPIVEDFGFHRDHKADAYGYPVHAGTPIQPGVLKNLLRRLRVAYLLRDTWFSTHGSAEVQVLHDGGDDPELARRTWARGASEIERFAAVARARDIVPLYVALGWSSAPEMEAVVQRLGVTHLVMAPLLDGRDPTSLRVSSRDAHPSALHHALIAEQLGGLVRPLLETWLRRQQSGAVAPSGRGPS